MGAEARTKYKWESIELCSSADDVYAYNSKLHAKDHKFISE